MSVASSSTDSIDKAIDEYCVDSSDKSSSSSTSDASGGNTDENYSSGPLGFLLKSFRNNLGELLVLKLVPHPVSPRLTRWMRKRLFLVVQ